MVDEMERPPKGSNIRIESYKHNREIHRVWYENIVVYSDENIIIGGNDRTLVQEPNGKMKQTKEHAIFYFDKRHNFNIIKVYDAANPYFYCNISSRFTCKDNVIKYVDYDIDIIVSEGMNYTVLDEDEFDLHKAAYGYSDRLVRELRAEMAILEEWIKEGKDPFNEEFINYWEERFLIENLK